MIKKIVLVLAFVMLLSLTACSGADDSEILGVLNQLAPRAESLYRVIYTDAMAHGDVGEDGYAAVSPTAEFSTIEEIEAAMEGVFHPDYCKILSNTAFLGVAAAEGEISAKFIEKDGTLYVNPSATAHFGEPRKFDLSDAKVIKKNKYMAIVRIPHADGDIEVSLHNTEDGWRINSPIY